MTGTIWDNPELLDKLEKQRDEARAGTERISFDCIHLKVGKYQNPHCKIGIQLTNDDTDKDTLLSVLRGCCFSVCKSCPSYSA